MAAPVATSRATSRWRRIRHLGIYGSRGRRFVRCSANECIALVTSVSILPPGHTPQSVMSFRCGFRIDKCVYTRDFDWRGGEDCGRRESISQEAIFELTARRLRRGGILISADVEDAASAGIDARTLARRAPEDDGRQILMRHPIRPPVTGRAHLRHGTAHRQPRRRQRWSWAQGRRHIACLASDDADVAFTERVSQQIERVRSLAIAISRDARGITRCAVDARDRDYRRSIASHE